MLVADQTVKIGFMDFNMRNGKAESGKPGQRAPDYASRAVKVRLATLVTLLGVAILAMHEAGKPETWEKMGFISEQAAEPVLPKLQPPETAIGQDEGTSQLFWRIYFRKLDVSERKLLLQLIDDRLNRKLSDADEETVHRLIEKTKIEFKKFATDHSQINDMDRDLIQLRLSELRQLPNQVEIIQEDTDDLRVLQSLLDRCALDLVEDRSSLGRSAESLAWFRSWQRLNDLDHRISPAGTNIVQLTGQPDAYRGRLIRIAGTAKGLDRLDVSSPELPFRHYFVIWVKPREMSRTPYCIYARELPKAFPSTGGSFVNINEPVQITGIFFKLRSYVATGETIETCPLIIANKIEWEQKSNSIASTDARWQPPAWLLTLFFIGIPVVATWLALGVYRSTKVKPIRTVADDQKSISNNLRMIANDQDIKSDRERVDELRQQLNDDED